MYKNVGCTKARISAFVCNTEISLETPFDLNHYAFG